jgi:formate dehydrogenase major subunit
MWGTNARDAHPIFFHHVLKGIRNGAKVYSVDPRRSSTAKWADAWLGIHVGSDISLANAIANEIIEAGLVDEEFIRRATVNFEAYRELVAKYPLERAERDSGGQGADLLDARHH